MRSLVPDVCKRPERNIMNFVQNVKDWLVGLGPEHSLVQLALKVHGQRRGFRLRFHDGKIFISKGNRILVLRERDYTLVPATLECIEMFFETVEGRSTAEGLTLDFSAPGMHRYRRWDVDLAFPGIPEDDSIDAYTHKFKPREGMVVLDVGAHAGLTTYFFAKMVGETGHVYAFEPDHVSRTYLVENVRRMNLQNVTVLDMAVGDRCGEALFNMDGSMSAGLVDHLVYPNTGEKKPVQVTTIEAFARQLSRPIDYIKMDIEGAELGVIEASLDFLKNTPIHFAFDSYHRTSDGSLTCHGLERLFTQIEYSVESSPQFGQMFTWASPPA